MLTNKLVHIHVPRTAGSSPRAIFEELDKGIGGTLWEQGGAPLRILDQRGHYPYSFYKDLCDLWGIPMPPVLAVVRNPWDWYVSNYHWQKSIRFHDFAGSFEDYLAVLRLGCLDNWNWRPFTYAWDWLEAERADHIACFENLAEDIPRILGYIDPTLPLEQIREHLLHGPRSKKMVREPYQEYYTEKTRQIVAEWDAGLIEEFGYEFE